MRVILLGMLLIAVVACTRPGADASGHVDSGAPHSPSDAGASWADAGANPTDGGTPTQSDGGARPTATCGDGEIGGTETCDDRGESAACDDDCTPVRCGDGKLNRSAREECDTGGPSATCAEDCRVLAQAGEACAAARCAPGHVCAAGACAPARGSCAGDEDCSGDTYCCTGACLSDEPAAPACIPYGTGDRGAVGGTCRGRPSVALLAPQVRCEWTPRLTDPEPLHANVLATPLVADLPYASSGAEILVVSYNHTDGGAESGAGVNPLYYGVLRVLDGRTCELLATIADPGHRLIGAAAPAVADLDNDGTPEIVALASDALVAFRWNPLSPGYELAWATPRPVGTRWAGPVVHDLDDDGAPEIISSSEVYSAAGERLNPGNEVSAGTVGMAGVLGDLDADGEVELVGSSLWRWDRAARLWRVAQAAAPEASGALAFAYADLGRAGASGGFDSAVPDGLAEWIFAGGGSAGAMTTRGELLFQVPLAGSAGLPVVADVDGDDRPEIAFSNGAQFVLLDFDCAGAGTGCVAPYVRWTRPVQDFGSGRTPATAFDFDGDGRAEVLYADECFARAFDGLTGDVVFSMARTSCTFFDHPVVADADRDGHADVFVPNNNNCRAACPAGVDPMDDGARCLADVDCPSGVCRGGRCRCGSDGQCGEGRACRDPIAGPTAEGRVCRAAHPGEPLQGLRVLRPERGGWPAARALWNQVPYTVTNVADDLRVPRTSQWQQNFRTAGRNDFQRNSQPPNEGPLPDLTARFSGEVCRRAAGGSELVATVCNRGSRETGVPVPVTFFEGDPADGRVLCTAETSAPLPVGACAGASCIVAEPVNGAVHVVANRAQSAGNGIAECIVANDGDVASVECDGGQP